VKGQYKSVLYSPLFSYKLHSGVTGALLNKTFNLVIFDGNESRKVPIRVCYELRELNQSEDNILISIEDVKAI